MQVRENLQANHASKVNSIADASAQPQLSSSVSQALIAVARIAFGVAWGVGAWLKWQPAFIAQFADQIHSAIDGQPAIIQGWLLFWFHVVSINPNLFGYAAAMIETVLAICFLCGLFSNAASILSIIWAVSIWAIPEAFGGPFVAGSSTDIGTAFPYIIMSLLLLAVASGRYYGLDTMLSKKLGRFSFLATGNKY